MNHTFTSVSLIACLAISTMASSQETIQYPYNPDVDNDEYISTSDLTGFLAQFGQDFQLAPVLVDGDELLTVLQFMQTQITSLQSQVASLEAAAIPGLVDYVSVDDLSHTVLISGANFQVVNGSESQLSENALGNIVVGYNPVDSVEQNDLRTGSHNLILGSGQTYLGSCNIIGGNGNQTNGDFGIVSGLTNEYSGYGGGMIGGSQNLSSLTYGATLGGKKNTLNSDGGAIVGGYNNEVRREQAVVVAGSNNWIGDDPGTNNRYGVICGGRSNSIHDGQFGGVFGGQNNEVNGELANVLGGSGNIAMNGLIAGGQGNVVDGNHAIVVGGLANHAQASWNSIFGGNDNLIGTGTDNCVLVGGESNMIQNHSTHSSILGGQNNIIGSPESDSRFSVISGGRYNVIEWGYSNSIFGGSANRHEQPTYTGEMSTVARSIFGGYGSRNLAGFGTSIVGGRSTIAHVRDADDPTYIPVDCLIGSPGRTFVGSTSNSGGNLVESLFGTGGQ